MSATNVRRSTGLDPRLALALAAGQIVGELSRRLGRGGGTTLPGQVSRLVDPASTAKLAARLNAGTIVVTGTNGKTTTTRLVAGILRAAGHRYVHNRSGANLFDGVASALVHATRPWGRSRATVGLFEVDEASVGTVAAAVRPKVLAVTNLFRDQLDRYGEVTFVANTWRTAIAALPPGARLVLNADDPNVAALGYGFPGAALYFGVDDVSLAGSALEHTADARLCPVCGARLVYERVYYGHLGTYHCDSCPFRRPSPEVFATAVNLDDFAGTTFMVGSQRVDLPLPGLYNVYNALSAMAVGKALSVEVPIILSALRETRAAFGRIEKIESEGKTAFLALVKNPVGFDQVLRSILKREGCVDLMIAINDNFADGTDVSWLWDTDAERLAGRARTLVVSGTRAEDMLVRLKYAGVVTDGIVVERSVERAFDRALREVPVGGTLFVMPTYTAMLDLRAALARRSLVPSFWED